ncbi:MAG: ATP-dependent Clp protease proteolytic subunit [Clostridia bacterium]|nr:ATP-dependent Clp protease proteolytic subunit [Clostridia bacterium]
MIKITKERYKMDNEKNKNNTENDKIDLIEKSGAVKEDRIYCISIVGQIEGHYILSPDQKSTKYEHIIPLLVSIEQNKDIEGLLVILNTMGGDVEAGLAISEMIASMKKPSVSLVLGGGHSIGVPLAVCTTKSFIVPSATMTIHPVRISGTVVGSPQTYYYFERMQDRITKFVSSHSGISEQDFRDFMMRTDQIATDTGSIIDGYEAQRCGLIDRVGGLSDALCELNKLIDESKTE